MPPSNSRFTRREFCVGASTLLTACTAAPSYRSPPNVEIGAVVQAPPEARRWSSFDTVVDGTGDDGHTHMLHLDAAHLAVLARESLVVLECGPASTDGHRHWVRVTWA